MKIKTFMAAIFIFFAFCSEIFSITATIGVKGGYFIWEPYIQEIRGWEDAKKGDGVLYGPLAGIGITDDFQYLLPFSWVHKKHNSIITTTCTVSTSSHRQEYSYAATTSPLTLASGTRL